MGKVELDINQAIRIVRLALDEDIGSGDVTTDAVIPSDARLRVVIRARTPAVVAGLPVVRLVYRELSTSVDIQFYAQDGDFVGAGAILARIEGPARPILTGERVALNFIQRLSGIATLTAKFVEAVRGTKTTIVDTRKTTPGLRLLEKYAVRCGGGKNHRFGLFDAVLIKDNHLGVLGKISSNPVAYAVKLAKQKYPELKVEVEVEDLQQLDWAIEAGADIVLLDNMSIDMIRDAVKRAAGRVQLEASGGITLSNVREIAETGVDYISVGALTHSAPAVDIGMDFE